MLQERDVNFGNVVNILGQNLEKYVRNSKKNSLLLRRQDEDETPADIPSQCCRGLPVLPVLKSPY